MQALPICVVARNALSRPWISQCFSAQWKSVPQCSTSTILQIGLARPFRTSSTQQRRQERIDILRADEQMNTQTPSKRESSRASSGKTSLRRVAVEAERSRRDYILGTGKNCFVDPEKVTKKVTAYCATEQYNVSIAARALEDNGLKVDPFKTLLYPQVVHSQIEPDSLILEKSRATNDGTGDVFVFPSGTVVTWNVPERAASNLVSKVLAPAATSPHMSMVETEHMGYLEDPKTDTSSVIGDTIVLGTGISENNQDDSSRKLKISEATPRNAKPLQVPEVDIVLAKIAFSSGLARSTKLAALESLLSQYFDSTRSIPAMLSRGKRIPFTRKFILRKTGELLSIRAQLNLYSELIDSLPDIFWDSKHGLGLEGYYDEVGRALDVGIRIKVLNEKMDYAQEIATVLRAKLSESHGLFLEWLIIALISVEVILELWRRYNDNEEKMDSNSTESLLRRYLKNALKEQAK